MIDATAMKSPLRRNMGKKNCEFTPEIRKEILRIFLEMEESEISRIFTNEEFGYWSVTVDRPLRLRVYPDREIPTEIFKRWMNWNQQKKRLHPSRKILLWMIGRHLLRQQN